MNVSLISDNIIEIFKNLDLGNISNYCYTSKNDNICNSQSIKDYLINRFIPMFKQDFSTFDIFDLLSIINLLSRHPYYLSQDSKYRDLLGTSKYKRFIIDKWIADSQMFDFLMNDGILDIINMILILYPIPESYENMKITLNATSKLNYLVYRSLALRYSDEKIINIINSTILRYSEEERINMIKFMIVKEGYIYDIEESLNTNIFIDYGRIELYKHYNSRGYKGLKYTLMEDTLYHNYLTLVGDIHPITGRQIKVKPYYLSSNGYPKLFVDRYLRELLENDGFMSGYKNGIVVPRDNNFNEYWSSCIGLLFNPKVTNAQLNQINMDEMNKVIIGTLNSKVINHFLNRQGGMDTLLKSVPWLGIEYIWKILDILVTKIEDTNDTISLYNRLLQEYKYNIYPEYGIINIVIYLHSRGLVKL
ncbi:Hypothetical protein ORPV_1097 [Orpheovirus IHUMI-LCC2]|uniref:Uncharacterized protein n=1 Tax=Orpheovirus IHUMI-LCC2 TaxID=2023057 RepID=A0A2I2L653_9VIRU|nr:Hypothetical protein ORPV_1097 [Orpheovirus IHUMI-LCC2]SNW63001.1 Hypothetical protein ORPV_1097 [Orpheovirus IHUMI-LCC2]